MTKLTIDQALQQGIEAHKAGQVQEADRLYTAILKAQPKHPDANHNMGVLAVGVGKVEQALPFLKTALEANPTTAQFWLSYIDGLIKLERLVDAKVVLKQARSKGAKGDSFDKLEQRLQDAGQEPLQSSELDSELQPKQPNILDTLKLDQALKSAKAKAKEGSPEEAKRIYQDILTKFPQNREARNGIEFLMGRSAGKVSKDQDPPHEQLKLLVDLFHTKQFEQALSKAKDLLRSFPRSSIVNEICGASYNALGLLDSSIEAYRKSLAITPKNAEAHYNIGIMLQKQGALEEAIKAYKKSLVIKSDNADAHYVIAFALNELGKTEDALVSYKNALIIRPHHAETYNNIGNILKEQGHLEQAIEAYSNAITIKPDYVVAYNNMGVSLQLQGKLEETIDAYQQALSINPNNFEAYINMGSALKEQEKPNEALEAYSKALAINPNSAEARFNMGVTFSELGNMEDALDAYNKALTIKPDYPKASYNMGIALKGLSFQGPNSGLQKTIASLLDKKIYVRPNNIAQAAISLLKFEPSLHKYLQILAVDNFIQSPNNVCAALSKIPLLLKVMSVCPLPDLKLENLLKEVRSSILLSIHSLENTPEVLIFQSALALQCFTNEYIYDQSERETIALEVLQAKAEGEISNGGQPSSQIVLCLASYKALGEYKWHKQIIANSDTEEVFKRQVTEPRRERQLKSTIPILEEITDQVSTKVGEQYEESPYPRWVNTAFPFNPLPISMVCDTLQLRLLNSKLIATKAPTILVAGCGTGQHSISTAKKFINSEVLAIDLSRSSLAYAKRKTEELGIKNITYMQADILNLNTLDRQFDIIECAGVLHHMDDPKAGWRVLTDRLKPGGLMKIGLYSELSRRHIVEIRNEIIKLDIGSSTSEMKSFRRSIIQSEKKYRNEILLAADFYSLSELRDLLFHVQEHRFTIPQLKDCLINLDLTFCGFEGAKLLRDFSLTNSGPDDPYDLDTWQAYEEANPRTFTAMYQFWCQKSK